MNKNKQIYFLSRLAFLIGADIPLAECLRLLSEQASTKTERKTLSHVEYQVSQGVSLSESFLHCKPAFNSLIVQTIKIGETTGTLAENIKYGSEELKKRQLLKQKIIGAIFYPVCIGIATLGVTAMIVFYILPKITPIFSSLNAKLPLSTKLLLGFHKLVVHQWFLVLAALVMISVVAIFFWRKSKRFKVFVQKICLGAPLFGRLMKSYEMAQTFRTLNLLLSSGAPLSESFKMIASCCSCRVYEIKYAEVAHEITKGAPLSKFLLENKTLFPIMVGQMFAVGESSGNLAEVSTSISEYFERELDQIVKTLSSALEPALMVIMGLVVGFVAISVISPIYEITQNIKK